MLKNRLLRWAGGLAGGFARLALVLGVAALIGSLQFVAAVLIAGTQPGLRMGLVLFAAYTTLSWAAVWFSAPPMNRLLERRVGTWLAIASQVHLYVLAVDTANNSGAVLQQIVEAPASWVRLVMMIFGQGLTWPPLYVPAFVVSAVLVFLAGLFSD